MISIVTTVYRSEDFLLEFLTETQKSLNEIGASDYEFIFVLDGITDGSKELLLKAK